MFATTIRMAARAGIAGLNGMQVPLRTAARKYATAPQAKAVKTFWQRTRTPGLFLGLSIGALFGVGTATSNVPPVQQDATDHAEQPEGLPQGDDLISDPLPVVTAVTTYAPAVPPPVDRNYPVKLVVHMDTTAGPAQISPTEKYPMWTFDGHVPGPFIRCRVGDVVEVHYTNNDETGIGHNIDFHAVTGPGGGAPALYAEPGESKVGTFKMLNSGLYVYHCAAAPVPMHIANGMYGLILVEPEQGLPRVDKEYYVMQSEFYSERTTVSDILEPSYMNGLNENPSHVVFNGKVGALTEQPLLAHQGDRVRIFFGNAGPNLVSSFHVIGTIFDKVYREGDLVSPPARSVQTTLVPAGGSTVVEMDLPVPGSFTLVDHSIFRMDKGTIGFLKVQSGGHARRDIYAASAPPVQCPGCKLHN